MIRNPRNNIGNYAGVYVIHIVPTFGSKVSNEYLLWATWSLSIQDYPTAQPQALKTPNPRLEIIKA